MKAFVLALACAALSSAPALAAPARSPKPASIFDQCMDRSEGVTVEMHNCLADEYARQDKALNATYRDLLSVLGAERREPLKAAQRAWLTYAKAECEYEGSENAGGSEEPLDIDGCWITLMKARIKAFKADAANARDLNGDAPPQSNPPPHKK